MTELFTPQELEKISAQIDEQLRSLGGAGSAITRGRNPTPVFNETQQRVIAAATGEDIRGFITRFKTAARKDVCEHGGMLYTQWTKWKDITNKDAIKTFGGILVGMGLTGSALQIAIVMVVVYVLYLGIEAFCQEV